MVNFGLLAAEICWGGEFEAPLQISTGFASWQRYCTSSSSGRLPIFAALNSGRHLCSAGRPSGWALAHILVLSFMVPLWNRETRYIFMLWFVLSFFLWPPYEIGGHYIFALWLLSFFLSIFFYSSPNLSGRRLDVYHTSTHGVALVRI